jgi:hypothetical protein
MRIMMMMMMTMMIMICAEKRQLLGRGRREHADDDDYYYDNDDHDLRRTTQCMITYAAPTVAVAAPALRTAPAAAAMWFVIPEFVSGARVLRGRFFPMTMSNSSVSARCFFASSSRRCMGPNRGSCSEVKTDPSPM